ncbi:MAG: AraC family transcriptional regulator [Lachnospiraceae bacterium]|nr:AraC family transcriptional regulator [Lachnospiraceae bacterium]
MDALFQGTMVAAKRIIYTPSDFARTNLLHLQETGELQALKPHTSSREALVSYLFFIILEGSGRLTFEGAEYPISAGDCVFVDCQKAYAHRSDLDLWKLRWVHFYGPNMNGIYAKYRERGGRPVFCPKAPESFADLLQELFEIAGSGDYIRDMRLFEKLSRLLTLLMEESWDPEASPRTGQKKQSLQHVKDHLEQHYQEKLTLDQLADLFFINKYYLTRIFKEQFGVSVGTYLTLIRVTRAKQLLRFSDLSVEQIGRECGIEEPAYFARVFKKVEGIAPGEYRKRW